VAIPNPYFYNNTTRDPWTYDFPGTNFDIIIARYGVSMAWLQSHQCACVGSNGVDENGIYTPEGTPSPTCATCAGRGTYYDDPQGPYTVLMSHLNVANGQVPGFHNNEQYGGIVNADPILTIPSNLSPVWENASMMDAFIEYNNDMRFESVLNVGQNEILPYRYNVGFISASVYDSQTQRTIPVPSGNVVASGANVVLSGYAVGTPYVVSYTAWPIYIAYAKHGGSPQVRPLIQGRGYPRRFVVQLLDLYQRNNGSGLNGGTL